MSCVVLPIMPYDRLRELCLTRADNLFRDEKLKNNALTHRILHDIISTLTPPSSSGPGRGPLKAKTRIRIPVGALFV